MNHPSEWQRIYHPKSGTRVYRHKGTGVMTDSLWKIGRVLKKPLTNLAKKTGEKVIQKASDVAAKKAASAANVVKKRAGDKIGSILRRKQVAVKKAAKPAKPAMVKKDEMMMLNNLLSQL